MPETPEELFARVSQHLTMPKVDEWDTFPFDGDMRVRPLRPPEDVDFIREGAGGVDCRSCAAPDSKYFWTNEFWRVQSLSQPSGLPVVVLMETRDHYAEPGDLPDDLARDLGAMIVRIERAIRCVPGVGRVHVCRWGDGGEHLHWWFMARPARLPQLIGSFAAVWDEILPPTPHDVWQANVDIVKEELSR